MKITAFFTEEGTPKTGLSPTVSIWKLDGTVIVNAQAMTEIAGGFYYYDFTTYDETIDYCIRADGTSTLTGADRYKFSTNETADVGKILKIQKNNWAIVRNQMIFYDDDGTTALYTFDLKDARGASSSKDVYARERA
jgi:hypothetical protein